MYKNSILSGKGKLIRGDSDALTFKTPITLIDCKWDSEGHFCSHSDQCTMHAYQFLIDKILIEVLPIEPPDTIRTAV